MIERRKGRQTDRQKIIINNNKTIQKRIYNAEEAKEAAAAQGKVVIAREATRSSGPSPR